MLTQIWLILTELRTTFTFFDGISDYFYLCRLWHTSMRSEGTGIGLKQHQYYYWICPSTGLGLLL
jgi:hypothetical protein